MNLLKAGAAKSSEIRRFEGHTGVVFAASFLPDGQRVVSCSEDGTLRLWDLKSGKELATFLGHTKGVHAMAVSPDGLHILSHGADKTLRLWDTQAAKQIRLFDGETAETQSLVFFPDGQRVLSGGRDGVLRVWDINTGQESRRFEGPVVQALTANSRGNVTAIDAGMEPVNAVTLSNDARFAVSSGGGITRSHDKVLVYRGIVRVWDVASGKELRRIEVRKDNADNLEARISADAATILTVAVNDTRLRLWNLDSGQEVRSLKGHGLVLRLALSRNGHYALSAGADKTVRLWDLDTGKEVTRLAGHRDRVLCVAFSPHDHRAVSASTDKTVRVWQLPNLARYYYVQEGQRFGPLPATELQVLTTTGKLRPHDQILKEGHSEWTSASDVKVLFANDAQCSASASPAPCTVPSDAAREPALRPNRWFLFARQCLQKTSTTLGPPAIWLASQIRQAASETWLQTVRLAEYVVSLIYGHNFNHRALQTQLILGERLYQAGLGDENLRAQITQIDELTRNAQTTKRSGRLLSTERRGLNIRLAEPYLAEETAPLGAEEAHRQARAAKEQYKTHLEETAKKRQTLLAPTVAARIRTAAGFGLICLLVVIFAWALRAFSQSDADSSQTIASTNEGTADALKAAEHYQRGVEYLRQGYDKTRSQLENGELGQIQATSNNATERALAEFAKAIELNPRHLDAYIDRAGVYLNTEQVDKALADINSALTINPQSYSALIIRGRAYDDINEHEKALADFNEAIRLDSKRADAYAERSATFYYLGDHDKALADANQALRLEPRNAEALARRAFLHFAKGLLQESREDLLAAVAIEPGFARAHINLCATYSQLRDYNSALQYGNNAVALAPRSAMAFCNRGTAHLGRKEYEDALDDYKRAIELQPKFFDAHDNIGILYAERGQHQLAIKQFSQVLELKFEPRQSALAYYGRGNSYFDLKQYEQAISDYTAALKIQNDLVGALQSRKSAYVNLKRFREAEADQRRIDELQRHKPVPADKSSTGSSVSSTTKKEAPSAPKITNEPQARIYRSPAELLADMPKSAYPKFGGEGGIEQAAANKWLRRNLIGRSVEWTWTVTGVGIVGSGPFDVTLEFDGLPLISAGFLGINVAGSVWEQFVLGNQACRIHVLIRENTGDVLRHIEGTSLHHGFYIDYSRCSEAEARHLRELKGKKVKLQGMVCSVDLFPGDDNFVLEDQQKKPVRWVPIVTTITPPTLDGFRPGLSNEFRAELESLNGVWRIENPLAPGWWLIKDGYIEQRHFELRFEGTNTQLLPPPQPAQLAGFYFRIDPTKNPKSLDMQSASYLDIQIPGIYELTGDLLRVCVAVTRNGTLEQRPKDFNANSIVLKRLRR